MSAAELLGVSPRTLRYWERRFGYPKPRRTPAGHREYDLDELEPLRHALMQSHSVATAIELARLRGTWPSSPGRLLEAFGGFDEAAADRVMEDSLVFRSVERAAEDVMLPALVTVTKRVRWEAEYQFAFRWATGWLFAARRVAPRTDPLTSIVLFDSSTPLSVECLRVQALEVGLRRAGMSTVALRSGLPPSRLTDAIRSIDPIALVLCGGSGRPAIAEQLLRAVWEADCSAPLFELGAPRPGTSTVRSGRWGRPRSRRRGG